MNTYSERITRPINLLPKGTTLSRYLSALVLNKGLAMSAAEYAQDRWRDTPEVHMIFRSVVEAGDTTTSGWASHLAGTTAGQELMAFLDSASVFNRLASSMHQILFRQPTPIETVPFSVVWISEAGATPVSQMTLATNRVNLELYKQGVLVVFTEELARFSSPGAESRFRNRFVASIAKATDSQFLTPTVNAISGRRPPSITNGATAQVSSGSTAAQVRSDLVAMQQALGSWDAPFWVIPTSTAAYLSGLTTTGGGLAFPDITVKGGTLLGVPVLTTTNVSGFVVLLDAASILFARDPIEISASNQAAIEMDTVPVEGESSPITSISVLVSLYQKNLVALKAIQPLNYQRGNDSSVVYMTVSY